MSFDASYIIIQFEKISTFPCVHKRGKNATLYRYTRKFKPFTDIKKVNQMSVKSQPFLCKLQCL